MTFKEYKYLIFSDLYRITGNTKLNSLLKQLLVGEAYKYVFWMKISNYLKSNTLFKYTLFLISRFMLNRYIYKFGIGIPYKTKIDSGFYIGHFSGIFVNPNTIIGKNCNISQGLTLGQVNRGNNQDAPKIGDNVYIGPGVKIVGEINIGKNVAIGANCVVTKNIPDDSVVVGIPGKVISKEGSHDYINRTNYDKFLKGNI